MQAMQPDYYVIETTYAMSQEPRRRIIAACRFEEDAQAVRDRNWRGNPNYLFEVMKAEYVKIISGNRERTVMGTEGNGLQAARIPDSGRSTDRGTAD